MTTTAQRAVDTTTRRPSPARLVEVELRKATDTRAGFWMFVVQALLILGVAVSTLLSGETGDRTLDSTYGGVHYAIIALLPVFGVLAVTSEWSQRTTLSTFCLVPERGRVIRAKFLAVAVLAVAAVAVSLLVSYAVFGIGTAADLTSGDWDLAPVVVAQSTLFQLVNMLFGAALGLLLLNSPAAIVLVLALPNLMILIPEKAGHWVNLQFALEPLLSPGVTGIQWTQILTVTLLSVVLPTLAGLARLARHEIK
jgi:ABC-2 type transport system permease protein